ncbi:PLP-dependent aspartate aminotransferase family protein [Streptomyces sp. NBC_00038]|uniref:trans-sulfuration enzyme family protein n=1 Tax=Streptomyces sp. NBC_00038 TaxID=2903615 RepID=UPI00225B52A7|nr:aminotransferase class I/II-fold pyridoxal phosphate-dependent enzyme [Streptomyces sp. NBC_00038]MCX5563326.1 PLP-dependent transferase [Streptomyces sp. NBC_00038]
MTSERSFATRAVHAGHDPARHNGSVTTPVYLASTFVRPHARPVDGGWDYSRIANPTRDALQECLASLEGGASAVAVASGMAASTTVLQALGRSGAHIVIPDNVYGGTWDLVSDVYRRWGLEHTAVDMGDLDAVAAALRPGVTALVWAETPSNPLLKVTDIAAVAALTHDAGALLVVDSTFASPYLQRPLALGADVVVHSTTKYLGGHSDITGGAVVCADPELGEVITRHVGMLGTMAAPQEAWLVQRGVKTLPVRMRQICESAQRIAEFLRTHPAVREVFYPGLASHPDHALAAKQMRHGFGGVVSLVVDGDADAAGLVCERTEVFTLAVSLGSVESLIEHPARMTHCTTAGTAVGVDDSLLRLSIGLEDCDELIADLDRALGG